MLKPKQVIEEWVKALNKRDAKLAAELYHEDAENLQVANEIPLKGKEAIYNDFVEFFGLIPDSYTNIVNLFEDGEWAILEWTGGGTFLPTSKTFTFLGCGFFHIKEGKIFFQRGYWDKVTWCKQVGIPIE